MPSLLPTQDSRALSNVDVAEVKALQGFQMWEIKVGPSCDFYFQLTFTLRLLRKVEEAMNIAPGASGTLAFRGHQMLLPTHPSIYVL